MDYVIPLVTIPWWVNFHSLVSITTSSVGLGAYFSSIALFLLLLVYFYESISAISELVYLTTFISLIYFNANSMLVIYMAFELTMAPVLVIVLMWGSQPEKVSAVYYAVVYTGVFSVPFLTVIVQIEGWGVSCYLSPVYVSLAYLMFLVKVPIFIVHLWLPKVHVEAPTSGSLVLAALLLKVGLFGLIKYIVLVGVALHIVLVAAYMGVIIAPLCASWSGDAKVLLAYSSVSHINLGLYGVNLLTSISGSGNTLLGLSHGYVSAILFFTVGTLYHYTGSRQVYHLIGAVSSSSAAVCVSVLILGNMGVPPFLSFWSELLLVLSILSTIQLALLGVIVYFVFAFYYSVYLIVHTTKCGAQPLLGHYSALYLVLGLLILVNLTLVLY